MRIADIIDPSPYTEELRTEFEKIRKEIGVWAGLGPAMAYIETPAGKRYVYMTFGMTGEREYGSRMPRGADPAEVIKASADVFRKWLQPGRTLLWREQPSIESGFGGWGSYWRCVQLDDDAHQIDIRWSI